jgi:hypothetical protein
VMFYDFIDGHIISGLGNVMLLTYYHGKKGGDDVPVRPRYMQFEVDAEHCQRVKEMVTFFEDFHFPKGTTLEQLKRKDPESLLYFTNTLDPYDSYIDRMRTGQGKVGGGCASYGAALLKTSGRFKGELDALWKINLVVSEKLIGGVRDRKTGEISEVSVRRLLFTSLGSYWDYSDEGYPNRRLSIYDPQKIWEFTGNVLRCTGTTYSCPSSTAALLGDEKSLVSRGEPVFFRGYLESQLERMRRNPAEAKNAPLGEVEQRVDGFLWRLP